MDELVSLSNATLDRMPDGIAVPTYDRTQLTAGILHIGLGNFHRGHQAWYLHRLMQMGLAMDWAIIGAGVRPNDADQRNRLLAQDCLTTLIELDPAGKSAEIIGSMIDFVPVEPGNASLIARMAQPDIRIVSLTVTEGGYYFDPATGEFDRNHPDIIHDAANPARPQTAFGAMIAALRLRREKAIGPFTGLCCDNLQGNGTILRRTLVCLARMSDPDLADWIDQECSFPNSMVDCIVPATGPREIAMAHAFHIGDAAPVTHENFRQWVIEDDFCTGRPELDKVGATFSDAVHTFETMKLRILNGGHQMISIPGHLLGIETISGCMEHRGISAFLNKTMAEEVIDNVAPVQDMTSPDYFTLIAKRFSNPEIIDTSRRVAFDGSSRQPGFIIPSIHAALSKGQPIDGLALMSALWMRYCLGKQDDGTPIEPNDPNWSALKSVAIEADSRPEAWLEQQHYYGDIAQNDRFRNAFVKWAEMLKNQGTEKALDIFTSR